MSPKHPTRQHALPLGGRQIHDFPVVVLQGAKGDWARTAIRPDLAELAAVTEGQIAGDGRPRGISVWLLDVGAPPEDLRAHEQYVDVSDAAAVAQLTRLPKDVVIVATPDVRHSEDILYWMRVASPPSVLLVEKPFVTSRYEAAKVLSDVASASGRVPLIIPYDHYLTYFAVQSEALVLPAMDDNVRLELRLTEPQPIEAARLATLERGLTFDLASHLLALLAVTAGLRSDSHVEVLGRGQHSFDEESLKDRAYFAETWSQATITSTESDEEGSRTVSASLSIGKGVGTVAHKSATIASDGQIVRVPLTKSADRLNRHAAVIDDLIHGGGVALSYLLTVEEAVTIVTVLEQLRMQVVDLPVHPVGSVPFPVNAGDWN